MKKFHLIIFCGLMCAATMSAQTTWNCGDPNVNGGANVTATLSGTSPNYTLTISGTGAMANYKPTSGDYPTTDAPWGVYSAIIREVIIGNGVTSIGELSFLGITGLATATIPESVTTISRSAFSNCSALTSVTIPESINDIGPNVFSYCSSLAEVHFNATNCTNYPASVNTFIGCAALTTVIIGDHVSRIPAYAFAGCAGITSVTIPESVTFTGSSTFSGCSNLKEVHFNATNCTTMGSASNPVFSGCTSLNKIHIGTHVTQIPDYAFRGCTGLAEFYFNATNCTTMNGRLVFESSAPLSVLNMGNNVTRIPNEAFRDCSEITAVTIPENVTEIGQNAFTGCSKLTVLHFNATNCTDGTFGWTAINTLTIGNNVSRIPSYAFRNCTGLTSVTIPEGVTYIDDQAFSGCTGLTSVDIPDGVTSIGYYAFSGCTGLTSVDIPDGITSIGSYAFSGSGLTSVTIPNGVTSIGTQAFRDCSQLATVYFNATNCDFFSLIFEGCTALTTLAIGNNVTRIPSYFFYGCTGLTSVSIPNSVTSIGNSAFYDCTGLKSATIPNGVTSIGSYAFSNSGLTSVTIPNGVISIGNGAFLNCSQLATVYFNATNCVSAYLIFGGCTALTTLAIGNNVTLIPGGIFWGCTGLISVTIPDGVTYIGGEAFSGCTGLTSVTIPEGVTTIGREAFSGCTGLTSVTIPEGVTYIDERAFSGCTGLTSVTIPNGVTTIRGWAFQNCSQLATVYFNATNCWVYDGNSTYPVFEGCTKLSTIDIGNNVTRIPSYFVYGCTGLTSVNIGHSVTSIGDYAFYNCNKLGEITIPNSVSNIGNFAFFSCTGLNTVTVQWATPPGISGDVFYNVQTNTVQLMVPQTAIKEYTEAEVWKDFIIVGYALTVVTIDSQPAATTTVVAGNISGSLSVTASVTEEATLSYQWYSNTYNSNTGGTPISGATSANFAIPATLAAGTHYYYCVVSASGAIPVRSNVAEVYVLATAPVITIDLQPDETTNVTAGNIYAYLFVTASITPSSLWEALNYQWYSNTTASNTGGTAIEGASSGLFFVPTNLTGGTYYYYCEVSADGATSVRSDVATVNVSSVGAPVISITSQPAPTTNVMAGSISGNLSVSASATQSATLSYQWYNNTTNSNTGGTAVSGATSASFTIPTTLTAGTYYYFCEVSATGGATSVRSNVATVNVSSASVPVITINTQPAATTNVTAGSISGSLTVAASVTQSATLGYQWYSNTTNSNTGGTAVSGATSASFAIPTTLTAGTYYYFCEVSATSGATSVRSSVATVNVTAAGVPVITITTQPAPTVNVTAGSIIGSLAVTASVTQGATLSYQWYGNTTASNTGGTVIDGARIGVFNIPAYLTAGTYYYFCEVSATGGAIPVRSNAATVNVAAAPTAYTVTFNSLGGSIVPEQTVAPGGKVVQPVNPVRTDYDFGGWYTDANYTNAWNFAGDIVTGNMTLYAKWTPVSVTGAEEWFASNLNIYPNPFTGEVRVEAGKTGEIGETGETTLRIINAAGVVVY